MFNEFFKKSEQILDGIIRGDYHRGSELEALTAGESKSEALADFTETMGLMAVKLEAREESLKDTLKELELKKRQLTGNMAQREMLSVSFSYFTLVLVGYVFFLGLISYFPNANDISSRILETIMLMLAIYLIRKGAYRLGDVGLRLKGARRSVIESLVFTAVIIGLLLIIRLWLIGRGVESLAGPLMKNPFFSMVTLGYLLVAFIQETLIRGIYQTVFYNSIQHPQKKWLVIILASSIFGAVHLNFSLTLAVFSSLLSIPWGWLYFRHRTVIGVTLSHWLIGNFAWLIGFWDYINSASAL
jgi:membrane protease YdiL (CAAX protease family)